MVVSSLIVSENKKSQQQQNAASYKTFQSSKFEHGWMWHGRAIKDAHNWHWITNCDWQQTLKVCHFFYELLGKTFQPTPRFIVFYCSFAAALSIPFNRYGQKLAPLWLPAYYANWLLRLRIIVHPTQPLSPRLPSEWIKKNKDCKYYCELATSRFSKFPCPLSCHNR